MTTRKVWITDTAWPTSPEVLAEALAAGATEVLHTAPPGLEGQLGYVEVDDPPLVVPDIAPDPARAQLRDEVVARLNNPAVNTITKVRNEIMAAFDAWVAQG